MLAGHPPFRGKTAHFVMNSVLTAPIVRLESIRPDVPVGVCDIVHRAIERNVDARIRLAGDMHDALVDELSKLAPVTDTTGPIKLARLGPVRQGAPVAVTLDGRADVPT